MNPYVPNTQPPQAHSASLVSWTRPALLLICGVIPMRWQQLVFPRSGRGSGRPGGKPSQLGGVHCHQLESLCWFIVLLVPERHPGGLARPGGAGCRETGLLGVFHWLVLWESF